MNGSPGRFYQIQEIPTDELWEMIKECITLGYALEVSSFPVDLKNNQVDFEALGIHPRHVYNLIQSYDISS